MPPEGRDSCDVYALFLVNVKLRSQMINKLLVYGENIRKLRESCSSQFPSWIK